ncbi:MAG TPA: DUF6807 family protein, partial [Bryobacteraceae bacterium]
LGARFQAQAQPQSWTLEPDPFGLTLKTPDGRIVFTYLTRKPDGVPLVGNNACCFHPVNTLAGERVTDIAPSDHRDHRGMFLAWANMDFQRKSGTVHGDFWGWNHFAATKGRIIVNREVKLLSSNAKSAEVSVLNDWNIDGEKVLDENTTVQVHEEQGARILDFVFRLTSDGDWGIGREAFTGFVVRCRKDGQSYLSDAKGKVTLPDSDPLKPDLNWPAADWYSYTIALNSGTTVAAALIDHPANPRSTWHEPRYVSFLNPCITALQPLNIPANQQFILRYRTVFHDGEFPDDMLNRLAAEWRGTKS